MLTLETALQGQITIETALFSILSSLSQVLHFQLLQTRLLEAKYEISNLVLGLKVIPERNIREIFKV